MSTYNCGNVFPLLVEAIYKANDEITDNVTNIIGEKSVKKTLVCVRTNVAQDFYIDTVGKEWNNIINEMINESPCRYGVISTIKKGKEITKKLQTSPLQEVIQEEASDYVINRLTGENNKFTFAKDFTLTMSEVLINYADNCGCDFYNLFKIAVVNYSGRYKKKYQGKSKEQAKTLLRQDFKSFNEYIQKLYKQFKNVDLSGLNKNNYKIVVSKVNIIKTISIEDELNNLIPDSMGAMKSFFVTMISSYYNNIHPVIWCQIFAKMCENFFIHMPITKQEFYQFVSGQLLLNSGPAILKILQMLRPFFQPEVLEKYNLTKLTYPLLSTRQVDMILKKILLDIYDYKTIANLSASVGHVVLLKQVNQATPIIIKIIKPISIVQSCSEYDMLKKLYAKDTCEQNFIDNMIYAIGTELDATNEIKNINLGNKYYTCDYNDIFEFNTGHILTTLEVIDDIIIPDCWYALAVTLAPGMPLSKLAENKLVERDTKFRASLHRCLDLLVYKFFFVLFSNGFYHGDLHAGNIFFSFKSKTMTLIDFGAVGNMNLFEDDPGVDALLEIIIMSIFYNYEDIADRMTVLLNCRCDAENNVDMESKTYYNLIQELSNYGIDSIMLSEENSKKYNNNINKIFSQERIEEESYDNMDQEERAELKENNIYSYLDILPHTGETVIENNDTLRNMKLENPSTKSFNDILTILFAFYATNGVNIPVKFSELYEFQKAYTLLLGVLTQMKYDAYRMSFAINKAIMTCEHLDKILYVTKISKIYQWYNRESKIYKKKSEGNYDLDEHRSQKEEINC